MFAEAHAQAAYYECAGALDYSITARLASGQNTPGQRDKAIILLFQAQGRSGSENTTGSVLLVFLKKSKKCPV